MNSILIMYNAILTGNVEAILFALLIIIPVIVLTVGILYRIPKYLQEQKELDPVIHEGDFVDSYVASTHNVMTITRNWQYVSSPESEK